MCLHTTRLFRRNNHRHISITRTHIHLMSNHLSSRQSQTYFHISPLFLDFYKDALDCHLIVQFSVLSSIIFLSQNGADAVSQAKVMAAAFSSVSSTRIWSTLKPTSPPQLGRYLAHNVHMGDRNSPSECRPHRIPTTQNWPSPLSTVFSIIRQFGALQGRKDISFICRRTPRWTCHRFLGFDEEVRARAVHDLPVDYFSVFVSWK